MTFDCECAAAGGVRRIRTRLKSENDILWSDSQIQVPRGWGSPVGGSGTKEET